MAFRLQFKRLAIVTALLLLCFARPLAQLALFALHSELFSYILLVPAISAYLIWIDRKSLSLQPHPCWPAALFCALAGSAILAAYSLAARSGHAPARQDYLAMMTLSFLCFFWGASLALVGSKLLRQIAFPVGFLVFAAPLPVAWVAWVDTFFQYTSAAAAAGFFHLCRTPMLRDGLEVHLPSFTLKVGPECSGIHSTLVLLLTSLMAGYMFLNRLWQRALLVLLVLPLAILRNGFRIFVIGELCVHISHDMIDSPIHRQGGPIFFALSLIPFFLVLVFLRKFNSTAPRPLSAAPQT
jgi:exosortase C (VPDSG-CTERM-specific)